MIILEGPDGGGKSTLGHKLANQLGYQVHAFGPPRKPILEEYLHYLVDLPNSRYILDRFHLGEPIYGPIYRGKSELGIQTRMAIELAAQIRGTLMIFCLPPLDVVEDTVKRRGDDYINFDDLSHIHTRYFYMRDVTILPHFTLDHYVDDTEHIVHTYRHYREIADDYRAAFPDLPGIGHRYPDVVLVGEKLNPRRLRDAKGVPFAVGPAGEWLYEGIATHPWAKSCYVTNAVKANGDSHKVAQEIRFLGSPPVIALGLTASKVLSSRKIDHVTIQHPAYARRFQHYSSDYAKVLGEAYVDAVSARGGTPVPGRLRGAGSAASR